MVNYKPIQQTHVIQKTKGNATSDGDGVKLTRLIGNQTLNVLDPFLMLDYFESTEPNDYLGGLPSHPHRGFETVSYLLAGKMRHHDNHGHKGVIEPGGVQWMTAGKGIVHSEMPEQENGLLQGFQLWVNLPKVAKMVNANYQEFSPTKIPIERRNEHTQIKVITGQTSQGTKGPVINEYVEPKMMHVSLNTKNSHFIEPLEPIANSFIYVIAGSIEVNSLHKSTLNQVNRQELAVLAPSQQISITALDTNTEFLFISALPINEPIARGGPFVMNTQQEIEQALSDYRHGNF